MMKIKRLALLTVFAGILAQSVSGAPRNLALNRPYSFSKAPNYSHCTDSGDKHDLTDGKYVQGYFWVQQGTVGWSRQSPLSITIDLGERQAVGGLSWSTAAGTAGVTWPQALSAFISDDQKTWFHLGDLTLLGTQTSHPPLDRYSTFRYATEAVRGCGRYVRFVALASQFIFVDEIEVWEGAAAWLDEKNTGSVIADPVVHTMAQRAINCASVRMRNDLDNIKEQAQMVGDAQLEEQIAAQAKLFHAQINNLPQNFDGTQPTLLPFPGLHERVLALNAPVAQARGLKQPTLWQTPRWAPLSLTQLPADTRAEKLELDLMRGEVRATAFNITQPAPSPLQVTLRLENMPAAMGLKPHLVLFSDTPGSGAVASALQPLTPDSQGAYSFSVPGGCTRQIWLSCHRPSAAPGLHRGQIVLSAPAAEWRQELPLAIRLRRTTFPSRPTLHVSGWDYTHDKGQYYKAPGNLEQNLALMRDFYVDTPWTHYALFPKNGKFDREGNLSNPAELDFTLWDEWVARWRDARNYAVFFSVKGSFNGEKMGTERFNRMVASWLGAWKEHFVKQGIKPEQFVILLVDEPKNHQQDEIIIAWGKAIKAAQLGVRLFEDPIYQKPEEGLSGMYAISDILCPNTPMMLNRGRKFRDFYLGQQAAGKTLWLYSCSGPARLLDPIRYYRHQAWLAFQLEAEATCFWAFGCGGGIGDSWHAYHQTGVEYSPYFVSPVDVMHGKQSEAIRESVQDYEYLYMLKTRVLKESSSGNATAWGERAAQLLGPELDALLDRIQASKGHFWGQHQLYDDLDDFRVRLLDLLEE